MKDKKYTTRYCDNCVSIEEPLLDRVKAVLERLQHQYSTPNDVNIEVDEILMHFKYLKEAEPPCKCG